MKNEKFVWIPGYENLYKVSNLGRVKSYNRYKVGGKILKPAVVKGYETLHLHKGGKRRFYRVHQLVALAFIDTDYLVKGLVVDHIDNDASNNVLWNLQVIDSRLNSSKDRWRHNYSSRYLGVSWRKGRDAWEANITIEGKKKFLGYYNNELEAAVTYQTALAECYG